MPWMEWSVSEQRGVLVGLIAEGVPVAVAARRCGVSRKTASKWWQRWLVEGDTGLVDRSRARRSQASTSARMVAAVVALRDQEPTWGGRKIRKRLLDDGLVGVPAASTITEILRREGRLRAPVRPQRDLVRFEAAAPNVLWQIDFKGDFGLTGGGRCYPLTMIDDHSRYAVGLKAAGDQRRSTVRDALIDVFATYGTPSRILCDHGPPWGASGQARFTKLGVWLIEHGIDVTHGRPRHPQTQGKDERFHRTLGEDVLSRQPHWDTLTQVQEAFDDWRDRYNTYRPHQALGLGYPADRYRPSPRRWHPDPFPLPYPNNATVRTVSKNGYIAYQARSLRVGRAFIGRRVSVTETTTDITIEYYTTTIRTYPK